jgi:hypothetical protein
MTSNAVEYEVRIAAPPSVAVEVQTVAIARPANVEERITP